MEKVTPKMLFGAPPKDGSDTVELRDIKGRQVVAERTWLFAQYKRLTV